MRKILNQEKESEIVQKYLDGETLEILCKDYQIAWKRITALLKKNRIEKRKLGSLQLKFDKDEELKIIQHYRLTKSVVKTAKHYEVDPDTIRNVLIRNNIQRRPLTKLALTSYQEDDIVCSYLSGESTIEIAKRYKSNKFHVKNVLMKNKVKIHSISYYYANNVNHNSFKVDTPDRNYWVGFLMADGCVQEKVSKDGLIPALTGLYLAIKDKDHVYKFAEFMNLKNSVRFFPKIDSKYVIAGFTSEEVAFDLGKFNIVPRKTSKEEAPTCFLYDQHFWRGMIDGDGWLGLTPNGYCYIGLCGSQKICEQFVNFAANFFEIKTKARKCKNKNLWSVQFNGRIAASLVKILYEESNGAVLLRKKKRADQIVEKYRDRIEELPLKRVDDFISH